MKHNNVIDMQNVAEIELIYNPRLKISTLPQIKCSKDAYTIFRSTWDRTKLEFVEQFKIMLLNRANRVLGVCIISSGSATQSIADPKMIFVAALKSNACGIILAHNHPSGNLTPSKIDVAITLRLSEAGKLLDVKVLDHLIISSEGYYSFADEGAL